LIGDDEHGWTKILFSILMDVMQVVNLSEENEPDIFRAIKRSHFRKNVILKREPMKLTSRMFLSQNKS
jgi:phosphoenolpyruvate carboxykinase (ATP)